MLNDTPFFPPWRRRLGRVAAQAAKVHACTLSELEERFAACVPDSLFPKAAQKENSRDRVYTRWRTFWCVLWQALQPGASGREVVRQLQALFALQGAAPLSEQDGAYCRARGRLPHDQFAAALAATARAADERASTLQHDILQGRSVKVVDGSTVTLADTPKNRAAYPSLQSPPPNFPLMRIVVLFSLSSAAVLTLAQGSLQISELALFATLFSHLAKGDILLADRLFGCYVSVALLQQAGVDFVGRTTRRIDGRRRVRRLGHNDWLFLWQKPRQPSPWLALLQWTGLPAQLTMRAVRGRVHSRGFRPREITVVTTLLDAQLYPPEQILRAYLRRWRLEMCLDDLKTTLQMETLRARSPHTVQIEAYARLIAHNLVRWTMACATRQHAVPLERISFKGTLDALRHFSAAMSRARARRPRQALWTLLLRTLAADLVPERPNRREPRAVKRKKNKYRRLNRPRRLFRDYPKRHLRRTRSRLRRLGLK
jgi:putative transposase